MHAFYSYSIPLLRMLFSSATQRKTYSILYSVLYYICRDRWYLARVQPLIPRIAHVGWN